jgi:hypothetical protein
MPDSGAFSVSFAAHRRQPVDQAGKGVREHDHAPSADDVLAGWSAQAALSERRAGRWPTQ